METVTKILYALIGIILPLALIAVNIMYYGAAIFPMIWLVLWLGFSVVIILPWE